ncbi:MAG: tripartite tricarboxylate transporter TctB family protein [Candidatus Parcubacteria bacterium]|nr:tripartite tricarboxylate transporter TctB family protein [Burkholderiales bacterium]
MKLNDALSGAALAALGAVVLWHIQSFPPMLGQKFGAAWFPGLIAVGLIICGSLLAAAQLRSATREPLLALPAWTKRARPVASVASVVAGLIFYVMVVDALGFHITAAALLLAWSRLLGASWRLALPVSLAATVVIHLAFYKLLKVPLPWGLLERVVF